MCSATSICLPILVNVLRCRARFQYLAPLGHNMIYIDHMRLFQAKRTELRQNSFGEHVHQMKVRERTNSEFRQLVSNYWLI